MEIEKIKNSKTIVTGKNILYYEQIASTQLEAKKMVQQPEKLPNGTILLAESQTNGIGTQERQWHTGEGKNLAFTIIYYPTCVLEQLQHITVQIAEAMVDTIQELYGISLAIKKPNDLLLKGKKIGGILTQSSVLANQVKYLLIGIGFNVKEQNFPVELQDIATSLQKEYPTREFSRENILITFLERLEKKVSYLF